MTRSPSIGALRIQPRCLHRATRSYGTSSPSTPAPPPKGFSRLSTRRLISLRGADAPKFLQGLTTNNLHASWTSGWYSAFLTAPGRVLYDVFIYPTAWSRQYKEWLDGGASAGKDGGDWSCLIEVDAGEVDSLAKHLKRHKLRSKVSIRVVEEGEWGVYASWGAQDPDAGHAEAQVVPSPTAPIRLQDPRVPGFGQRLILPSGVSREEIRDFDQLSETDASAYTLRRYLHGISEGQKEILKDSALPQESNIDLMNGIDFRKGCYVGQELTIRTHHTGVVRKRLIPVQFYSKDNSAPACLKYDDEWTGAQPASGADIKKAEGRGRSAGKVIATAGNIGLGLCRLEMMTDVRLTAEGGMYKEGDEFAVQGPEGAGEGVKIKAFVPEWIRSKLQVREPPRRVE